MVFFTAAWSGAVQDIKPILDQAAAEYSQTLSFYGLDIDGNAAAPTKCGVKSVPNLILFKNGLISNQIRGATNKGKLREFIEKN